MMPRAEARGASHLSPFGFFILPALISYGQMCFILSSVILSFIIGRGIYKHMLLPCRNTLYRQICVLREDIFFDD